MPLGCAVLLTQPAPLTGTATPPGSCLATCARRRRSPHPSRGRQPLKLDSLLQDNAGRSPHPSRGRQLILSCNQGSTGDFLTQPAPLTGTATPWLVVLLGLLFGRSPHPSRGRQLILSCNQGSTGDFLTQPTPLTGTGKQKSGPREIPVGRFSASVRPRPLSLLPWRLRRLLRPARAELAERRPAHRLQPDVTAGAVVRVIPEGKAGSSAALWAHVRRPLKNLMVRHEHPS